MILTGEPADTLRRASLAAGVPEDEWVAALIEAHLGTGARQSAAAAALRRYQGAGTDAWTLKDYRRELKHTDAWIAAIRLSDVKPSGAQSAPWPRAAAGIAPDVAEQLTTAGTPPSALQAALRVAWASTRGHWVISELTQYLATVANGHICALFAVTAWHDSSPGESHRRWADGYAIITDHDGDIRRVDPTRNWARRNAAKTIADDRERYLAQTLIGTRLSMAPGARNPVVVLNATR